MAGLFEDRAGRGIRAGGPADRGGPARAQAQRAARTVGRQAPLARGPRPHVPRAREAGAALRLRRRAVLLRRRCGRGDRRAAPRRLRRGCRAALRRAGAHTLGRTAEASAHISDLQFTESYRVPFQFSPRVRAELPAGSFVAQSSGVQVTDLDGNARYDLTGSYGVNLLGYDFYKGCMERGAARVAELGPVLGHYPSLVADNAARLARISGKDEVSFHMSGTEAVMQAVRLARYHTGRSHAVVFCGAYHGWWGDVQPGVGNPVPAHETYTLADMSERYAGRAALAARHCLRAGEPRAGHVPQQRRAGRFDPGREPPGQERRSRRLRRLAQGIARRLLRARHRADLRRGLPRLPRGAGRRPGIFRRAKPTS